MSCSTFRRVIIKGISSVVPENEINIYDEARYYGNNTKKIDRMRKIAGFYKRRVVEEGTTASDLAVQAAEKLIKASDIDKKSIDALIFVRQRPDYSRPATAFYIHEQLGLQKQTFAFDISLGCTGWMQGMFVAHTMIESGACKRVLLLAGDTPTSDIRPDNRVSAPVFGDGGAATLLEYSENENLSFFDSGADGSGFEAIITPASGYRFGLKQPLDLYMNENKELMEPIRSKYGHDSRITDLYMDGVQVFDFTMREAPASIKRVLEFANLTEKDIDYLMLHQANKQIIQTVANLAGFPEEKAPYSSFENYGNASVVSIPILLNHILADGNNKKKVLCCSFGNGLAWCSGIFNFDNVYFSGVQNYAAPENKKTRQDWINYWKEKIKGEKDE